MKCDGTKYLSVWDWLTYTIVGAIAAYMVVMYLEADDFIGFFRRRRRLAG